MRLRLFLDPWPQAEATFAYGVHWDEGSEQKKGIGKWLRRLCWMVWRKCLPINGVVICIVAVV